MSDQKPPSPEPNSAASDADDRMIEAAMIEAVYSSTLDPARFDDLVTTWDAVVLENDQPFPQILRSHFEQARKLAGDPRLDPSHYFADLLDVISGPAILMDAAGQFLAANAHARMVDDRDGIEALISDAIANGWGPDDKAGTLRLPRSSGHSLLAMCSELRITVQDRAVYLIKLESSLWTPEMSEVLRTSYGLSDAEIEVAQRLHAGQAASDIAKDRTRSLETIRSQIKSLITKTGARKQHGLLQLLAHLQYLGGQNTAKAAPSASPTPDRSVRMHSFPTATGGTLVCAEYGPADGLPVLYFTTSSPPTETDLWREACFSEGLRVLAPYRPGFGASTGLHGGQDMAVTLAEVLRPHLPDAPLVLAGHREGGILAAQVAGHLKPYAQIKAVCLVSTGVPLEAEEENNGRLTNMQRSIGAALNMPAALRFGYATAARMFNASRRGERHIVSYFFNNSPIDTGLIQSEEFWKIGRDNIAYSFENTDMIVEDIARWASDWPTTVPNRGDHTPPWVFVQGEAHDFLFPEHLNGFIEMTPGTSSDLVPKTAQLMLYQRSHYVAQVIARQFTRGEESA